MTGSAAWPQRRGANGGRTMARDANSAPMIPTEEWRITKVSGGMQLYLLSPQNSAAWVTKDASRLNRSGGEMRVTQPLQLCVLGARFLERTQKIQCNGKCH